MLQIIINKYKNMKSPIKFVVLLVGLMVINFSSCQKEVVEETPPNQEETILPNSTLANLMRNASANDGSRDNIMDGSDCFTVNLPVTIVANGITITIESIDDLSLIEAIFNQNNTDEDDVEFLFPLTIILNDYTEVTIESLEELEAFIEACIANEAIIECVDFVYPVSFSIYNTSFQIIDTVEIHNDYEMYIFLQGLENGSQGGVLASLNFPVSLMYVNGNTVEVTNNQELEEAINAANENCDTDCIEEFVVENLQECYWNIVAYNNTDALSEYSLNFKGSDSLQVTTSNFTIIEANWQMSSTNTGSPELVISNFIEDVDGSWLVENCSEDRFQFVQEATGSNAQNTMVLEQDCTVDETPFNCFADVTVTACDFDNDGFATFELETLVLGNVICNVEFIPSFHETLADAENNMNSILQPNNYTNTTDPQTIYLRIEADNGAFEIYEIVLITEDCSANCSEVEVDEYLQECQWVITSYNNNNDFVNYLLSFNANQDLQILNGNTTQFINGIWSTSTDTNGGVLISFSNINDTNLNEQLGGDWYVVVCSEDRFELINGQNTMVLERDCTTCDNPGTLTNDLIIYMPFGNEVRDLIGGTVISDFNLTEDRAGNEMCASSFNGVADFSIPVTAQNQLVQGDSFSISVWFKMQNTDAGNLEIFFRSPGNATQGFNLGVYDLNTPVFFDNLNTSLWDDDWNQEVDVMWENTDWHHLVVTVDSNNTVRLYRDGILRNIAENSDFSVGAQPSNMYIMGEGFVGHLDDLRVYKRTLNPNEVTELYNLEADCYTCF